MIHLDIEDGVITSCSFENGCRGNLQGICRLIIGRKADEVAEMLSGVVCRDGTSCPDQLAKAIRAYK